MSRIIFFIALIFFIENNASFYAQNIEQAKKDICFLTSAKCFGRGYINNGMTIAAKYLARSFREAGIKPLNGNSYFQDVLMNVNTFPGNLSLSIDGKKCIPGKEFLVENSSRTIKGKFKLKQLDSITFVGLDAGGNLSPLYVKRQKKLTWSVSQEQADFTTLELLADSFRNSMSELEVDIQAKLVSGFKMQNICGFIEGTTCKDSFIVFTAHYDHLGSMGRRTFFPGANDNASGVSMVLQLARYFRFHPLRCNVVFLLFCGEEAGLVGSKFFVDNPCVSLGAIKFLINLDLLGTGDEGITVVNATEHPTAFNQLKEINGQHQLLPQLKSRGKAANSDHFWFAEKGVPAFFIYTLGGVKAYHDVYDVFTTLPLTRFSEVFNLLIYFTEKF